MPPPTPSPTPDPVTPSTTILVTLSPAPAPTTQTVVVELPPEVVQNLKPADGGLSQPSATVIAAVIAVVAALIAFSGVIWQVRSAATQQQKDRDAENRRQRRVESSQLLADGVAVATAIEDIMFCSIEDPDSEEYKARFVRKYGEALLLCYRMQLVGLSKSATVLETFVDSALEAFGQEDKYPEHTKMHGVVIETFSAELHETSNPIIQSARKRLKKTSAAPSGFTSGSD